MEINIKEIYLIKKIDYVKWNIKIKIKINIVIYLNDKKRKGRLIDSKEIYNGEGKNDKKNGKE